MQVLAKDFSEYAGEAVALVLAGKCTYSFYVLHTQIIASEYVFCIHVHVCSMQPRSRPTCAFYFVCCCLATKTLKDNNMTHNGRR